MIKVVIIEDESLLRLGIKALIDREPDMEICGEAGNGLDGLKVVQQSHPDVVLVDIGLPDISGLEVTYQIKQHTDSKVVIITNHRNEELADLALSYGANSFILKKTDIVLIRQAILSSYKNDCFIDPSMTKQIIDNHNWRKYHILRKGKKYNEPLSTCETEVLRMIACGLSNDEIARKLFVTLSTVKTHANNILIKLNARNRSHAIIKGIQFGYINSLDVLEQENFFGEKFDPVC
ncbi:hypothetical protein A6770_32740 [Nostoc minutum NIES-26]|uniref:DNA-binding response regulator n=1 Tax=Nostoc minutum NIES-26 TaxID=1844469 RepID=A0A367Q4B6_9NOSO|nr:hypothetical protein A6770_32740 [Nostoc minutum NIES-26]